MKIFLLSAAMLVVLAACNNTSGVQISDSQMSQFTDNKSTLQDVESALGTPTSTKTDSSGTTTISYTYSKTTIDPTQYIPVVGLATAGAQTQEATVATFIFNSHNVLISHSKGSNSSKTNGYLGSTQ